ncbi:hypothetical protein [Candidatus Pristimantibacillus sp. PTI5]|uniref:hypothetical protein n=1 Tax=Candidatus Pristimantibacillus sp. PTI5 TaxID=3400422 RepID=UPI003B026929
MSTVIGITPIISCRGLCRRLAMENVSYAFIAIISTGYTDGMIPWATTEDGLRLGRRCPTAFEERPVTMQVQNRECSSIRSHSHRRTSWEALLRPVYTAAFMKWGLAFSISRN